MYAAGVDMDVNKGVIWVWSVQRVSLPMSPQLHLRELEYVLQHSTPNDVSPPKLYRAE